MVERKARHNNSVAIYPGKRIQVVLYNKLPFLHIFCWYLVFLIFISWLIGLVFLLVVFQLFWFFKSVIERRFLLYIFFREKRGRWNE